MFLFLSKLLPLFFYPLGLACVLMVVALVLWWKRSRWTPIPISLALIALLVGSNGWVSNALMRSLEWQNLPAAELPSAEAIVILGGATKPASPPRSGVDLSEEGDRVLYGAELYRKGKAPLVIASGGRIDWRRSGASESGDMAVILETLGVPKDAILQDPTSLNTYENAVNVRQILRARGIRQVLLVTSAFHMPRSLLIFKRQGIEAIAAPTDFLVTQAELREPNSSIQSTVLNVLPDAERLQRSTRALKEYIGIVIYRLRGWL
ncbi:YdcF family protein [Funiculus sociatus GB2-A5]|uniref:YdcF family protein n=1 Tax=Funiculus sociatus GB2-A5 TaxID=2933946 RepID=A0ABV0JVD2_9CYAN|nr:MULTISPECIES: YdcF family protein [unclassified Trichocoleus]MBD1904752.1 YdcF family protein [Trichocoleus sp. FACHB-832]MBD2062875.1 YdcF family protein [Trichocoleus sp. FACHB-6]